MVTGLPPSPFLLPGLMKTPPKGSVFQVDPRQFFGPSRYGTISWTSSFLTGFTRSSRFTPRYMAIAAATKTEE